MYQLLKYPYDGNAVGKFEPDCMQRITGSVQAFGTVLIDEATIGSTRQVVYPEFLFAQGNGFRASEIDIDTSRETRVGPYTKPPSISEIKCISY